MFLMANFLLFFSSFVVDLEALAMHVFSVPDHHPLTVTPGEDCPGGCLQRMPVYTRS